VNPAPVPHGEDGDHVAEQHGVAHTAEAVGLAPALHLEPERDRAAAARRHGRRQAHLQRGAAHALRPRRGGRLDLHADAARPAVVGAVRPEAEPDAAERGGTAVDEFDPLAARQHPGAAGLVAQIERVALGVGAADLDGPRGGRWGEDQDQEDG
jgi:hypothetical protein